MIVCVEYLAYHLRNLPTQECVNSIDAGSQVCSLLWSRHSRELVTSHGFTDFQLSVWKYPSLARIADLKGHESRVLYTALSPDGKMVPPKPLVVWCGMWLG